jgi:hypothetical protein
METPENLKTKLSDWLNFSLKQFNQLKISKFHEISGSSSQPPWSPRFVSTVSLSRAMHAVGRGATLPGAWQLQRHGQTTRHSVLGQKMAVRPGLLSFPKLW